MRKHFTQRKPARVMGGGWFVGLGEGFNVLCCYCCKNVELLASRKRKYGMVNARMISNQLLLVVVIIIIVFSWLRNVGAVEE